MGNTYREYNEGSTLLFPRRGVHLHSMVKGGGRQLTCNHSYSWDGTKRGDRDMLMWQYTVSGCGAVEYNSRTFYVGKGEAFLLMVPEKHRYYLPENSSYWEFIYLSFSGSELIRLAGELRRRSGAVSPLYGTAGTVSLANSIIDMIIAGTLTPHQASSMAYSFLMQMLSVSESVPSGSGIDIHQAVHEYCLAHMENHPDINELASVAGFSRGHFYRKFKEETGKNPHEFVIDLKMRFAMRKLQTENITVKEVAAACGFDDPSYFCKVFKKSFGVSPAMFRGENTITEEIC